MAELAPTEITALARILDDLDYYQLLHLPREATPTDIKRAYHATARAFHPDGNRHHNDDVRWAIHQIAKRITEAYSTLRNPRRRAAYDQLQTGGGGVRMQLAEAEAAERQQTQSVQGQTPQGRQYFNLATSDMKRRDFGAAIRNLQTALTFEPGNEAFRRQLAEVRKKHIHG